VVAHELAHALFIPHALHKTESKVPPIPLEPAQHVVDDTCIMNYDQGSAHFCGFCMLRLRGWDWTPMVGDKFAVTEIKLVNGTFESTSVLPETIPGPPTDPPVFCFASEKETVNICYTISDSKALIDAGRLDLISTDENRILWTRPLSKLGGDLSKRSPHDCVERRGDGGARLSRRICYGATLQLQAADYGLGARSGRFADSLDVLRHYVPDDAGMVPDADVGQGAAKYADGAAFGGGAEAGGRDGC
jgi:hypothetical protein